MKPIQTLTRLKLMEELIGDVENKIILDIGIMDINISKDFNPKKILTLDILPELKPDILYDLNNTKEKIPLEDNSIDIIIAGEVIEHLIDPNKVISEFHRILKSDGILVISTPNICSLVNRVKMFFGKIPNYSCFPVKGKNDRRHYTDYNKEILIKMFEEEGFEVESIKTNGIILHSKRIFLLKITPLSFGENFVMKCKKIE